MKKPFQVVRINTKSPIGSRKELFSKITKSTDPVERKKLLENALYPNRLKRIDEENK